jgi:nuclear autoantigenic sperm protein
LRLLAEEKPKEGEKEEKKEMSKEENEAVESKEKEKTEMSTETEKEKMVATEETETDKTEKMEIKNGESKVDKTAEGAVEENEAEDEEEDGEEEEGDEEDIEKNEEGKEEEAEADEISNLQRSWEMFELAKLIYSKQQQQQSQNSEIDDQLAKSKRVAECLLKLGEISIEQEIYEQAITDVSESIRMQESLKDTDRDERMLAESFYQLGLAQQFSNQFTEANESYQKSINIMQLRIEKLKGKLAELADKTDEDSELQKGTMRDEIGELEALLPEMSSKLEEVNEQGQQSLTLIKEAKECFLNSLSAKSNENGSTSCSQTGSGEVKDITSLVKSKRKVSETNIGENGDASKKKRFSSDAAAVNDAAGDECDSASASAAPTTTDTNGDMNHHTIDDKNVMHTNGTSDDKIETTCTETAPVNPETNIEIADPVVNSN